MNAFFMGLASPTPETLGQYDPELCTHVFKLYFHIWLELLTSILDIYYRYAQMHKGGFQARNGPLALILII
jgi:hypothetical protein